MDSQDHRKNHSSGLESHGVHVCHRCGWPFPNPHPSARHRRAHKRICGTIEGYKLLGSEETPHVTVSDDEHLSDEDHKTPSPKMPERSNVEKGIGVIRSISNKSEDEVFSDAVTEFPDNLSSMGSGNHKEMQSGAEKIIEESLDYTSSMKDDNTDSIQNPTNAFDGRQAQIPEIREITVNSSEASLEYQDDVLPTKESAVMLGGDRIGSTGYLYPVKPEAVSDVQDVNEINAANDSTEYPITSVGQEANVKGNEEIQSDRKKSDLVSPDEHPREKSDAMSSSDGSEERASDLVTTDGVAAFEKDDGLSSNISSGDLSSEVVSVERMDASVDDTAQTKVDAAEEIDISRSVNSIEGDNVQEGLENVLVLSLPGDIRIVDNAAVILEDFKDHKGVKFPQSVISDSCDVVEGDIKVPVAVEDCTSFSRRENSEGTDVSASDKHALKDEAMVKEVPVNNESIAPQIKLPSDGVDQDLLRKPEEVAKIELEKIHTVHSPEEQKPHKVEDQSHVGFSETSMKDLSDFKSVVGPSEAEFNPGIGIFDVARSNDNRKAEEENTTESVAPVKNLSEGQVRPITGSFEGDENLSMKTRTACESSVSLHESQTVAYVGKDVLGRATETECSHLDGGSDAQKDVDVKPSQINGDDKLQGKSDRDVDMATELVHGNETSEAHMTKYNDSSTQMPASVADDHRRESNGCGLSSEPLQRTSESDLIKHQFGPSAADVSVDSISRSESLEGNWGSVSVLSIQSDAPPVVDAESLQSFDNQTSIQAEAANAKKKPEGESVEQHSEKSEIFEPPSFMTLVEPSSDADGDNDKAGTSEIQKAQKQQQQKTASLQAGWFPSLTHVVNESEGRKKNEEIIAKVTNWSTGKQHTPLKSLLSEANPETKPKSPRRKDFPAPLVEKNNEMAPAKGNGTSTTPMVSSILDDEARATETAKEWNSPARYPADIKREKRKVKGRPYWAQFVCCTSMN